MTWYLNTIYLGEGCYGVKSAANVYFAKGLDELTVAPCACLVGITNNPYRYDPYLHPEKNRERQLVILKEMLEQELIDQATYNEAIAQKMVFQNSSARGSLHLSQLRHGDGRILPENGNGGVYRRRAGSSAGRGPAGRS